MKNGCKYIIAILLLVLSAQLHAQVNIKAGVDHDKILIGEPVLLSIEAYVPLGSDIKWFSTDSIAHFDIIRRTNTDTAENMDGKKITQLITITSFDSGKWTIPPFEVFVAGQPYYSDSLTIDVSFQEFDPKQDYRDIKDIVEVASPYVGYIPWIVGAITLLSLAGIIILMRRKKPEPVIIKQEELPSGAYEEAMKSIKELRNRGLGDDGEKGYYSTLNDILRKYVARNFKVSTFERTNEELIIKLSTMGIPKDAFIKLSQSLRMSDFVKFAKYRPTMEDNISNLETVRSSIEILNTHVVNAV